MIETSIKRIVDKGNVQDMYKLGEIVESAFETIKKYDKDCYNKFSMKLYQIANGKILTQEMAEKIVNEMKPYGQHWTISQTRQVQRDYGLTNIRDVDFWVVMNSVYNDFHELYNEDLEMYVKHTQLFINDKDSKEGKVFTYFMEIPINKNY